MMPKSTHRAAAPRYIQTGFFSSLLEVVEDHDGDAYRAVYTVRIGSSVYVLHVFQKKSAKGVETPRRVMELVRQRLAAAERLHVKRSEDS
jgi:phage-related protein